MNKTKVQIHPSALRPHPLRGEVQEWLNWQHWKCCERETVPWVRIPPSPPVNFGIRIPDLENSEKTKLMKQRLFEKVIMLGVLSSLALSGNFAAGQSHTSRQRARAAICGNPKLACKTTSTFQPNDLPFRIPKNSVIFDTELFYAIILKSVTGDEGDCNIFVPESERLAAQELFPDHKVFASRCADIENLFYTNVSPKFRIMAVYAGTTLAESKRVLAAVKATGKFSGAYVRRMRTGFNGT